MMEQHQRFALKMLYVDTKGSLNPLDLMGAGFAGRRASILSSLLNRHIPRAQAGVGALKVAFYELIQPVGDCIAAREESFAALARKELGL